MAEQPEMKLDKGKRNNEVDPLLGSGYEHLPEVYVKPMQDGTIVQERDPCYQILEPGAFLGIGREATLWEADSQVVTTQPPNAQMWPLNRAAALAVLRWRERLPETSAPIDIGDLAEAAQYLASEPEIQKLGRLEYQRELVKFASQLKGKRDDRGVRDMPLFAHNFARPTQSTAPPILGGRIAEMGQRFPGETRFATALPQYGPGAHIHRAAPSPFTPGR